MAYSKPWKRAVFVRSFKRKADVEVALAIEIDWDALAYYFADKLVDSKTGTSRALNGVIRARRVDK